MKFASFNSINLRAHPGGVSAGSFEGSLWYLRVLPEALGWPTTIAAVFFVLYSLVMLPRKLSGGNGTSSDGLFLLLWFTLCYIAFTLISLKEVRHGIPVYLPVVFACFGVLCILPFTKWRSWVALWFGVAIAVTTLYIVPPQRDVGYAEAAAMVAREAPENAVVMFAGHKDGDFVYNIRSQGFRNDITVLRADKLLLDLKILPSLGLNPRSMSSEEIREMLIRYGVSYVVSDEKSFLDAGVIRELMSLLHSGSFERISEIDVSGTPRAFAGVDKLVVYKNLAALPEVPEKPVLKVATGRRISN
jgi:hypothetical protein